MPLHWTASIHIAVTEAHVRYMVTGMNDGVFGAAEISGNATISRLDPDPSLQELQVSLTIDGRTASEVKSGATVWPAAFDEITTTENIIGIVLKRNEFDQRQGHIFLHPAQFDRLMSILKPPSKAAISLYLQPSAQSECDLIVRIDFNVTI